MPGRAPGFLVVGLGNPGTRYSSTRHNVGFRVADLLVARRSAGGWQPVPEVEAEMAEAAVQGNLLWIAKPSTYMNRSGRAVVPLLVLAGLAADRLVVAHDDLDLPFGRIRIRQGSGHGGHNGIRSIIEHLGTGQFLRLKLGIGRPAAEGRERVTDHVLSPFAESEESLLSSVLALAADALESIVVDGPTGAMNRFNA